MAVFFFIVVGNDMPRYCVNATREIQAEILSSCLKKNLQNYAIMMKLREFNATFISIRFEEVFNRLTNMSPSQEIVST